MQSMETHYNFLAALIALADCAFVAGGAADAAAAAAAAFFVILGFAFLLSAMRARLLSIYSFISMNEEEEEEETSEILVKVFMFYLTCNALAFSVLATAFVAELVGTSARHVVAAL